MFTKTFISALLLSSLTFANTTNAKVSKASNTELVASSYNYYEQWIDDNSYDGYYTIQTNWDDEYNDEPFTYKWYVDFDNDNQGPLYAYCTNKVFDWTLSPEYNCGATILCEITRGNVTQWEGLYIEQP